MERFLGFYPPSGKQDSVIKKKKIINIFLLRDFFFTAKPLVWPCLVSFAHQFLLTWNFVLKLLPVLNR